MVPVVRSPLSLTASTPRARDFTRGWLRGTEGARLSQLTQWFGCSVASLAGPTPEHQVSEEQEQPYARKGPPGFLPASPFSRGRLIKPLNTILDFVRIEHFAAGLFRQPAEKCHIRFQLPVFLRIGRDVGNRRHRQRRFTRFSFCIHREKVNSTL